MENGYFIDSDWSINTEGRGRKIPTIMALFLAPVMGLVFLMFLPFIGFYLCLEAMVLGVFNMFPDVLHRSTPVGQTHLTGDAPTDAPNADLEKLHQEIQKHRDFDSRD